MNATPPHTEAPDELDRLFSEFFKAQLKHPWPNAPVPVANAKPTAPSGMFAARTPEAPARRDTTTRARVTLAASVALLLGTCWSLSNGFQPGTRPGHPAPGAPTAPGMFLGSGADGDEHPPLKTLEEDKAKGNVGPKIDMGNIE